MNQRPAEATMRRRTQGERSQETRSAIVAGAMRCLQRSGYAAATMARIAEEAGVTRGALQHHFDDRRALMLSVVEEGYRELTSELNSLSRVEGAVRDRVNAIIDGMLHCYATPHALAAFEVVLALRDDDEFSGRHLGTIAPFAVALDGQWLELFADTSAPAETIRAARQVARASVLGLIMSSVVGLGPIDPHTVDGLKESILHLLSPATVPEQFGFTHGDTK